MTENMGRQPSADHPVRGLFLTLTERGMGQSGIRDAASIGYVAGLMLEFIRTENMYTLRDTEGRRLHSLLDLIILARDESNPAIRLEHHKHLGDLALFMLGLFPEHLDNPRRPLTPEFYAEHGRRAYRIVADLGQFASNPALYRMLAERFEQYVEGLHWVKRYIQDPFFQYMFREFGVT